MHGRLRDTETGIQPHDRHLRNISAKHWVVIFNEQHDFDRNYVVGICQKWEVGKCQKTVVGKCPRKPSLLENVRIFFVGK